MNIWFIWLVCSSSFRVDIPKCVFTYTLVCMYTQIYENIAYMSMYAGITTVCVYFSCLHMDEYLTTARRMIGVYPFIRNVNNKNSKWQLLVRVAHIRKTKEFFWKKKCGIQWWPNVPKIDDMFFCKCNYNQLQGPSYVMTILNLLVQENTLTSYTTSKQHQLSTKFIHQYLMGNIMEFGVTFCRHCNKTILIISQIVGIAWRWNTSTYVIIYRLILYANLMVAISTMSVFSWLMCLH